MGISTKIGVFISELRQDKKLSQLNLSSMTGVTLQTVKKWESGKVLPDVSSLAKLAVILGVTADEILVGEMIASPGAAEFNRKISIRGIKTRKGLIIVLAVYYAAFVFHFITAYQNAILGIPNIMVGLPALIIFVLLTLAAPIVILIAYLRKRKRENLLCFLLSLLPITFDILFWMVWIQNLPTC